MVRASSRPHLPLQLPSPSHLHLPAQSTCLPRRPPQPLPLTPRLSFSTPSLPGNLSYCWRLSWTSPSAEPSPLLPHPRVSGTRLHCGHTLQCHQGASVGQRGPPASATERSAYLFGYTVSGTGSLISPAPRTDGASITGLLAMVLIPRTQRHLLTLSILTATGGGRSAIIPISQVVITILRQRSGGHPTASWWPWQEHWPCVFSPALGLKTHQSS